MPYKTPEICLFDRARAHWKRIAFDVRELSQPIAETIFELARDRHWQLISTVSYRDSLPFDVEVCGALTGKLPTTPQVQDLVRRGVPVVRIGKWGHPDDPLVPAVIEAREAYGRLAADHFAERGFKHVGYIGQHPWQGDRVLYEGFAGHAKELGCQCHLLQMDTKGHRLPGSVRNRWEARKKTVTDWLRSLPLPIGLLCAGDAIADRHCHWILEADFRLPEDIAVLGVGNNTLVCEPALISISSIEPDSKGIAEHAVRLLDRLMAGQSPEQPVVAVPPLSVVTRQSSDVLAAKDPKVVKALQIIRHHVTEDLSVDWIVSQVGVSRRSLERSFQIELGRGIHREIQRRRLASACRLLLHTSQPISEIADFLNFSSHQYFCRAFRTAYGLSPAQYRHRQLELASR